MVGHFKTKPSPEDCGGELVQHSACSEVPEEKLFATNSVDLFIVPAVKFLRRNCVEKIFKMERTMFQQAIQSDKVDFL